MKHSKKNNYKLIAFILILLVVFGTLPVTSLAADAVKLDYYSDVRGKDLSGLDLKDKEELLFTLTFDNLTGWPSRDRLPDAFDPAKLLEQGKKPGLGIKMLQREGYTGKGVSIAYIDQHILPGHDSYTNVDLHNSEIQTDQVQASMHGPAVLSLLAGREIGIVPNATVYFFGHNGQSNDNEYEARAFEKIVEMNKSLPGEKKIRIAGMSHAADDNLDKVYAGHLRKAQEAARKSGIIVVDVACGMATCGAPAFNDREDPSSYRISNWEAGGTFDNSLFVPADFRTTGSGYLNDKTQYIYWGSGGFSWGVPYITGVITMGLQIDPGLTEQKAFEYLRQSWHPFSGGGIINPEGFLQLVRDNCTNPRDISLDKDYRYFLYNSGSTSEKDMAAINEYTGKFKDGFANVMLDVSGCSTANEVYGLLKKVSSGRNGSIEGIQIFGTSKDVPAFDVNYKIQMETGIDEGGIFKTDFFYSNFNSDVSCLNNSFSIYKAFKDKLKVGFIPEWSVSRLPLSKDEIAPFIQRCFEYASKVSNRPFGSIVNFSSPIFASDKHTDDMTYFIRERLDKEFGILDQGDYRLYGNKQGFYPLKTDILGDFTKENIVKENKAGIKEFIINSHGQWNNIDQCIFTTKEADSEKRISFLNNSNINTVLSANYYDLDVWTCLNAYNLDDTNLIHEAMSKGRCISAMAASSVISNNGVDNTVSYQDLKKNNFYYFYLNYFYNLALGRNRSESFTLAQKGYAEEVLKNTDLIGSSNYQFNLHNVLSYHYLGLLEYWKVNGKTDFKPSLPDAANLESKPAVKTTGNITFNNAVVSKDFKISSLRAINSGKNIKLVLTYNYTNSSPRGYNCFNPPGGDTVMIFKKENGVIMGMHTLTFTIPLDKISKVKEITIGFSKINNNWSGWDEFISFNTSQFGDYSGLPDK
jgi:serine protease AprX